MTEYFFNQQSALRLGDLTLRDWRARALAVAATGILALCAHISIPLGFTPVPLTMQTFAVLLLAMLFSPGVAFMTMVVYLAEGASGLPVFSPAAGGGGIAQLIGPTGGYLLSYPLAAVLASSIYRMGRRSLLSSLAGALSGSAVILMAGALWLEVLSRAGISLLLKTSVLPFVPGDLVKAAAAALCVWTFRSLRVSPAKE